jgi:hypothetical protein
VGRLKLPRYNVVGSRTALERNAQTADVPEPAAEPTDNGSHQDGSRACRTISTSTTLGGVTTSCFLQKGHPPTVNLVARLEPKMEAQASDGSHSGFVGGLASKPVGDSTECIGVIRIHVLDDSWRGLSAIVGRLIFEQSSSPPRRRGRPETTATTSGRSGPRARAPVGRCRPTFVCP